MFAALRKWKKLKKPSMASEGNDTPKGVEIEIIPSLLVNSADEFKERLKLVEEHVKTVQIDILDGSMFGKSCWFDPEKIGTIKTSVNYELHLMIENPLPVIEDFSNHTSNTTRAIIHAELDRPLGTIIEHIQQNYNMEAGVALNPETPIDEIHHIMPHVDEVLIMGVHPGASGQAFGDAEHGISGEAIFRKIKRTRERYPQLIIGIDGGVNLELSAKLIKCGANRLSVASTIFGSDEPVETLWKLQEIIKNPN